MMLAGSTPAAGGGLRERKRAATQTAIERAAIALALEHGFDNVTVDMICEAAMVSQRTFFNYFGSKEGVIVGAAPAVPSQDKIDAFVATSGSGVLADFVAFVSDAFSEEAPDVEMMHARRTVIQRTPQLMEAELAKLNELEERSTQIVLARFHAQHRVGTDRELEEEARMVVSLASGVMRYLMRAWSAHPTDASPAALVRNAITVLTRLADSELRLDED